MDWIRAFCEQQRKGWESLQERRDQWRRYARPLIESTIDEVTRAIRACGIPDVYWQTYDQVTNYEMIQFWFGQRPSGIAEIDGRNMRMRTEIGAAMGFSLSEDARVGVWRTPFHIEDRTIEPSRVFATLATPQEVSRDWALERVSEFLVWALPTSIGGRPYTESMPVGFRLPPPDATLATEVLGGAHHPPVGAQQAPDGLRTRPGSENPPARS